MKRENYDTKIKMVENHLRKEGSITSWEAINRYRATRLSDIIFRLKNRGHKIKSVRKTDGVSNYVEYYYISDDSRN